MTDLHMLFEIRGQTAVITGGSGHFGRAMAHALAQAGAHVAILGRNRESAQAVATAIQGEGGTALAVACDVMSRASLEQSQEKILSAFGQVDILINAAGGNSPAATTSSEHSFFDLDTEAINHVFGLNCT
ncbi:MAG TPA: SDR family NAD(P)-dependent oxidoreductase, partial [Ktedonobacteraceae bacterium]|nr:SDR family NAD(P)-dependent oxidoreductase [Ktedonobacteraceae bacterium]